MKNLPLPVLGLIYVAFALSTFAQTPEQARNFQINPTHTGTLSTDDLTPPLRQRWIVSCGHPMSYPLIADTRVFVPVKSSVGQGTTLYALNAPNGAVIW